MILLRDQIAYITITGLIKKIKLINLLIPKTITFFFYLFFFNTFLSTRF